MPVEPDGLCATPCLLLRLDIVRCTHGPGTGWAQDGAKSLSPKVLQSPGLIPGCSGAGAAQAQRRDPAGLGLMGPQGLRARGQHSPFAPGSLAAAMNP